MDKTKVVVRGQEARTKILEGINEVADTVRLTLGPAGANVLVDRDWRSPRATNDGVFIASNIELDDEAQNLAAQTFVEVSKQTNDKVGDGTTTSMVIASEIINNTFAEVENSSGSLVASSKGNVMEKKREIHKVSNEVIAKLKEQSTPIESVDDLVKVATVSMESEAYGKVVGEMVHDIGPDGFVDVVEGHTGTVEADLVKGMKQRGKCPAPFMITNQNRKTIELEDFPVVVTDHRLDNVPLLTKAMHNLQKQGLNKALILCSFVTDDVLLALYKTIKSGFPLYIVKCPSLDSDELEDVAAYCDAKFISKEKGGKLTNMKLEDMGAIGRFICDDNGDIFIRDARGNGEERVQVLKDQIRVEKDDTFRKRIEHRIASLSSGVGVIRVSAPSDIETGYLKLKFEDAVNAAKAALEEGVVKGGGLALKEIAESMPHNILTTALLAPYNQIQENAGEELEIGEEIVDPTKVVRLALENACSVAGTMITTDAVVATKRDRTEYDGLVKATDTVLGALKK